MSTGPLPPLYSRWMLEALSGPLPDETRATCDRCPMVPAPDRDPQITAFAADTKCCTYQPDLQNFLVGAILADRDRSTAWARELLEMRIAKRTGVTPRAITPDAFGHLVYTRVVDPAPFAFGRLRQIRCPYYLQQAGGQCGVWKHRNAICATWFCKFERGLVGRTAWRVVLGLLRAVEMSLSTWVVLQLDPGIDAIDFGEMHARRTHADTQDAVEATPPAVYRRLWGTWHGREAEFFQEAARLVGELSWADVQRIGGTDVALMERLARAAYERLMSTELPTHVTQGPDILYKLHPRKADTVQVVPPSMPLDPLDIDASIMALLPPPGDVREADFVDPAILRKLLDYGVLAPSPRGAP